MNWRNLKKSQSTVTITVEFLGGGWKFLDTVCRLGPLNQEYLVQIPMGG